MKKIISICLAVSALAFISCKGQSKTIRDNKTFIPLEERQQLASHQGTLPSSTAASGVDFRPAAKRVTPAVVHIKVTLKLPEDQSEIYQYRSFRDFWGEDWFRFFEPFRENLPAESSASGVILTDDGYINYQRSRNS